jgi:ATP phosphoribosyltransferase regulatory subunit
VECFGAREKAAADVEVLLLAVEAVRSAGLNDYKICFGDIALFYALIDALNLPERWRLKLRHYFWRPPSFHSLVDRLAKGERLEPARSLVVLGEKLAGKSQKEAEDIVSTYLEAKGIPLTGNRSLREITARLRDQAEDLYADTLPKEVATVIEYYLGVAAPPREAVDRVAMIAHGAGLDIDAALHTVAGRFDLLEQQGVDLSNATFATEFGRKLEYYSGLVFQIEAPGMDETEPVAGGGRYDNLLSALGAPHPVPAVGVAIHTERLLAAVGRTPS